MIRSDEEIEKMLTRFKTDPNEVFRSLVAMPHDALALFTMQLLSLRTAPTTGPGSSSVPHLYIPKTSQVLLRSALLSVDPGASSMFSTLDHSHPRRPCALSAYDCFGGDDETYHNADHSSVHTGATLSTGFGTPSPQRPVGNSAAGIPRPPLNELDVPPLVQAVRFGGGGVGGLPLPPLATTPAKALSTFPNPNMQVSALNTPPPPSSNNNNSSVGQPVTSAALLFHPPTTTLMTAHNNNNNNSSATSRAVHSSASTGSATTVTVAPLLGSVIPTPPLPPPSASSLEPRPPPLVSSHHQNATQHSSSSSAAAAMMIPRPIASRDISPTRALVGAGHDSSSTLSRSTGPQLPLNPFRSELVKEMSTHDLQESLYIAQSLVASEPPENPTYTTACYKDMLLPLREIFFYQDYVCNQFMDGRFLTRTIEQLRSGEETPETLPHIEVIRHKGRWYGMGNRRLACYHLVFRQDPLRLIPCRGMDVSDDDYFFPQGNGEKVRLGGGLMLDGQIMFSLHHCLSKETY